MKTSKPNEYDFSAQINKSGNIYFEASEVFKFRTPTPLYGLQPYSVGTGACESLTSYICRIADEHRISVFSLINDVVNPMYNLGKDKSCCSRLKNFVPMGELSRNMVIALSLATGSRNISACTLNSLQGILGANGLYSKDDRHCQLCFDEAIISGDLYYHHIWNIACVAACPIHSVQLINSKCCSPVNNHLNASSRKVLYGVCSVCGSIGYQCGDEKLITASPVEIWRAQQVAQLISCLPDAENTFTCEGLFSGLNLVIESFAYGSLTVAASRAGIHKSVLWGWINSKHTPSLRLLLDLCMAAGVSLVSVIRGEPISCHCPAINVVPLKLRTEKVAAEQREIKLRSALNAVPPISLSEVSRQLGLESSALRRKFPELSTCVVNRFRQYLSDQKSDRIQKAMEYGQSLIKDFSSRGLSLTSRNIYAETGIFFRQRTLLYPIIKAGPNPDGSP